MATFLMVSTSSITKQTFGKIVRRVPAVSAKMWCLFVYRQDAAKRQTADNKFALRPKIWFFAHRSDSLHRFWSNLAGPTGTWIRLAVQNFTSIGAGRWECGPKISKNFYFLSKSRLPLDRFLKFWRRYSLNRKLCIIFEN